jgi:hypothetical protein
VRDPIVSGQLQGGDFIRPESIAQELDISLTPVREGLLALRTQASSGSSRDAGSSSSLLLATTSGIFSPPRRCLPESSRHVR